MGPLEGIRIVEFAGLGPGPYCGMLFADMGADVIRIDRKGGELRRGYKLLGRSRRSIALNLKTDEGLEACFKLIDDADALIEGYRPGVMERLGLGPDVCLARNPKIVYGRMTGWGQDGPMAQAAGHDINYISLTGALHAIGRAGQKPAVPLNLIGDFGGGGMFLAFGVVAALLETRGSGKGQVVDVAMTDGAASLMTFVYSLMHEGKWKDERGINELDGGSHFYDVYECKDGGYVSIGSIEPQFYALLLEKLEISDPAFKDQGNSDKWPELKDKLSEVFLEKSRDEWCAIMEGSDICFAPVLSLAEAPEHPQNKERGTFVTDTNGLVQPAPAPRFSRTPSEIRCPNPEIGAETEEILSGIGYTAERISDLKKAGAI